MLKNSGKTHVEKRQKVKKINNNNNNYRGKLKIRTGKEWWKIENMEGCEFLLAP